ncbi:hypothetical protein BDD43_0205 [Mucilaginibacter gracilis]|uniref:Uncharacterized protein n=1 Tax=Mucilaginibacter gracilis TaxID=423350 RepID=A0A495ITW4_9SPHI|nr:hypothetical protein BDD43_0205 [Mucilaginibacter gracilis]
MTYLKIKELKKMESIDFSCTKINEAFRFLI